VCVCVCVRSAAHTVKQLVVHEANLNVHKKYKYRSQGLSAKTLVQKLWPGVQESTFLITTVKDWAAGDVKAHDLKRHRFRVLNTELMDSLSFSF